LRVEGTQKPQAARAAPAGQPGASAGVVAKRQHCQTRARRPATAGSSRERAGGGKRGGKRGARTVVQRAVAVLGLGRVHVGLWRLAELIDGRWMVLEGNAKEDTNASRSRALSLSLSPLPRLLSRPPARPLARALTHCFSLSLSPFSLHHALSRACTQLPAHFTQKRALRQTERERHTHTSAPATPPRVARGACPRPRSWQPRTAWRLSSSVGPPSRAPGEPSTEEIKLQK